MRIEMSNAEAITRIDRFLAYLEKIWTPQHDYDEALIRRDDITAFVIARDALKNGSPSGEWIKDWEHEEHGDASTICSRCRYSPFRKSNFCPNCGADMRRKEGE